MGETAAPSMSYTAAWNPALPQRLMVFGVSNNKHLNLREYDATTPKNEKTTDPTDTTGLGDGILCYPGAITGIPYMGWTRVFAFVDFADKEGNNSKQLSMVSPVHSWLNQTTDSTVAALGSCLDKEDEGYLYYVNASRIYELALVGGDPKKLVPSGLLTGTSVAATRGTNQKRYIAYQIDDSNKVEVWCVEDNNRLQELKSSDSAKPKSPLAVVQYDLNGASYVQVYWVKQTSSFISRATIKDQDEWSYTEIRDSGKAPSDSTTLTATWDPVGKKVVLTYALKAKTRLGVVCIQDQEKWA